MWWGEDAVEQEDIWGSGRVLLEDFQQSGSCHPPNSGLLPPDDQLPVDFKQEEYSEDSMVTDLFLETDPTPAYEGSHKHTSESTSVVTEAHRNRGSIESEQLYLETKVKDIKKSPEAMKLTLAGNIGGQSFNCKECGKGFSRYGTLKIHMLKHTGEKLTACQECEAGFSQSVDLKKHMRTHTGEKPFTCKECGAGFSLNDNLKIHMRSHTGEKPFTCKECGAGFSNTGDLKKHMRSHTGEKPFTCKECGAGFSQSSDL